MTLCTSRSLAASVAASVLVALVGCSGGGTSAAPTGERTPAVSLPGDASASPPSSQAPSSEDPSSQQFAAAVEFTRLVHIDDYEQAGSMVADNTPAARYIAYQNAYRRAYELNGDPITATDPNDVTIDGDKKTGTVQIEIADGDKTLRYAWSDFTLSGGKVASWTGKSGPIDKALWSTTTSDKSKGVTAKLVAAYVNNTGNLGVVIELASADRAIRTDGATYSPKGGYRQDDIGSLFTEVSKGEKALTMFTFPKTTMGGKLSLEIGRIDDGGSYEFTNLELTIK